ncbi:MAG TPA: ATP-binding protein [Lapillicoccus sp.]|nr:ATP-binding protein [Lapillicoccus sp.]
MTTDDDETRRTLSEVRRVARLLLQQMEPDDDDRRLLDVLEEHLGRRPDALPVTREDVPHHRSVDADIAVAEIAGRDPDARLLGAGGGEMRHHFTFGDQLNSARMTGGGSLGQVEYLQQATGPGTDDHRNIVALGMWLFRYRDQPVVIRLQTASPHMMRPVGAVDVLAVDDEVVRRLVGEIRELMTERSVIKGQVLTFAHDPYGHGLAGITFFERPHLTREDVILPEGLLDRVGEHVLGIAEHRAVLAEHGQHLKRGILLFGPPGTGKTHTMRYLLSQSPGTTVVLLSGGSLQFIHDAAKVARAHQPAIVVLEDCDLIAEDRSFGPMAKPLLFEVLDALDGIDADADVAFLLTTNRVEQLERALSQRPGRVDLAAEIPLPDTEGRRALIRLYAGGLFSDAAVDEAADRAEGTTASFARELVRRAVLLAATSSADPGDEHLATALTVLLDDTEALTRSLLGVGSGAPGVFPGFGQGGF